MNPHINDAKLRYLQQILHPRQYIKERLEERSSGEGIALKLNPLSMTNLEHSLLYYCKALLDVVEHPRSITPGERRDMVREIKPLLEKVELLQQKLCSQQLQKTPRLRLGAVLQEVMNETTDWYGGRHFYSLLKKWSRSQPNPATTYKKFARYVEPINPLPISPNDFLTWLDILGLELRGFGEGLAYGKEYAGVTVKRIRKVEGGREAVGHSFNCLHYFAKA